ncbi:MAG TPA: ATP-binding protein [Actinomycetota bacterium]
MLPRLIASELAERLASMPAVALLGPRQAGKTTLAFAVAAERDALYLDLESDADRARLAEPELYLADHLDKLLILDEIHRLPGLFPVLRGLIDRARRRGKRSGLYLLLGSGTLDLARQSGESLAGRIAYMELTPFIIPEIPPEDPADRLWTRGGFPDSYLAADDLTSVRWRQDFIRTYLERDVPMFGPRIPAETLRRVWTMLAHNQGGLLNVANLARNVGIDARTAARYVDLLVDMMLVRRLPAWHANVGKRLVKSPKIYVRDSGILHALLAIADREALLGHPVVGASWEGFVIENLLSCAPPGVSGFMYRTAGGAEIDLVLAWPDQTLWAVEVKRSLHPRPARGFHAACEDLQPARRFIVYPGDESYPTTEPTIAIPPGALARELLNAR